MLSNKIISLSNRKKKNFKTVISLLFFILSIPIFAIAANDLFWSPVPPRELGPLIVWFVTAALIIGGFIMVVALIVAGLQYLTSAGDPKKVTQAKDGIIKSLMGIGLLVVFSLILYTLNPELLRTPELRPIEPPPEFLLFLGEIDDQKKYEIIFFDPFDPAVPIPTVSIEIYWGEIKNAKKCRAFAIIPEGAVATGWEGNKDATRVKPESTTVLIAPALAGTYSFFLRCYNKEGFGVTRVVSVELKLYETSYRIPTGKIIEWAVFDYNARKRFEKTQYFIQSAEFQSKRLKTRTTDLVNHIRPATCGMTTYCSLIVTGDGRDKDDHRCVPANPIEIEVYRRVCGVHEVGQLEEEVIESYCHVVCIPPAGKLQRIIGDLNTGEGGVEGILLAPQNPDNIFMPFKERRDLFFGIPYPIDKSENLGGTPARLSIIFPPLNDDHSGAFNHWRVDETANRKWINFLVEKRKIESARREIEAYKNTLQLASYLMSVGCKYHQDRLITHNQMLPVIVRDPFFINNERTEVIDIIKKQKGIIIRDLINWQLKETSLYEFVEKDGKCEKQKIKDEQRMAVINTILEFSAVNGIIPPHPPRPLPIPHPPLAPGQYVPPDPIQWRIITCPHAATIFEYDPFTFYCDQYYDISKINELIEGKYRITDIRFRPNPSSGVSSTSILSSTIAYHLNGKFVPDNQAVTFASALALDSSALRLDPIYAGDVKRHEIPSGQAVEEAMYLLTEIERNLENIRRAMERQEEAALGIVELAFDCDPKRCNPNCYKNCLCVKRDCIKWDRDGRCIARGCVDYDCTCAPEECEGHPYNIREMNRLLGVIEYEHNKALNLDKPNSYASIINGLIHDREQFDKAIWLFPREMTRIEKIEALTHQTRAMFAVCPVRPRGLLYYVYGGEIKSDPVSFIEIRKRLLEGETIEGLYSIRAGLIDCREDCRPPNRETPECKDCLRNATIACRSLCLIDPLSESCVECIPGRSLLNYFCLFLEERDIPK